MTDDDDREIWVECTECGSRDVVLNVWDEELMDEIREQDTVYVAGTKYHVSHYIITPDPETGEDLMVVGLSRVFPNTILRCPEEDCNGEKIKVKDRRYAGGERWECNNCEWVQQT